MVPRTVKIGKFKMLGLKTSIPFKTHTLEGATYLYQLYREVFRGGGVVKEKRSVVNASIISFGDVVIEKRKKRYFTCSSVIARNYYNFSSYLQDLGTPLPS